MVERHRVCVVEFNRPAPACDQCAVIFVVEGDAQRLAVQVGRAPADGELGVNRRRIGASLDRVIRAVARVRDCITSHVGDEDARHAGFDGDADGVRYRSLVPRRILHLCGVADLSAIGQRAWVLEGPRSAADRSRPQVRASVINANDLVRRQRSAERAFQSGACVINNATRHIVGDRPLVIDHTGDGGGLHRRYRVHRQVNGPTGGAFIAGRIRQGVRNGMGPFTQWRSGCECAGGRVVGRRHFDAIDVQTGCGTGGYRANVDARRGVVCRRSGAVVIGDRADIVGIAARCTGRARRRQVNRQVERRALGTFITCRICQGVSNGVGAFTQRRHGCECAGGRIVGGGHFGAIDVQTGCATGGYRADVDARRGVVGRPSGTAWALY